MTVTKITPIRLPLYIKEAIHKARGKKTLTAWVIEAIRAKLK